SSLAPASPASPALASVVGGFPADSASPASPALASVVGGFPADTLDLTLNCTFDKPYDVYIETNFVNRTIGRLGPELKLGAKRRNLFRGGEILDINLHGSYEWQTNSEEASMSTYQYGADGSIEFPRILLPRLKRRNTRAQRSTPPTPRRKPPYANPSTILKLSTDIIRRPDYYKMHIVSGEWTYRWQPTASSRHEFSPITLKYQYMNTRTEKFEKMIEDNPYLLVSMDDYFIPKMRYTYTHQTRHTRWETTLEESGNVTALYDVVVQGYGWQEKNKPLFKNPYSQYIKIETDLTKTWYLDSKSQLIGHLNAGVMWSYGNSTEAPFSERFYVGGANTIRAFSVRSIGPGAYSALGVDSRQLAYLLRNGDSKLVMNLEYRRQLAGSLYGAIFLDAGNIWSTSDYTLSTSDIEDDSPEAQAVLAWWNEDVSNMKLKPANLLKQLATGTGIGLRYDLDFLVIRLDWGFGLHLPYDTGRSSYFNIPRFRDMHSLHFAVGYPF
ncbi:MAG: BamA/TamA family outer membrane protein, partial [Prevotella sp.]|nr:BamA/TamA family outer membrane protein [Prevotella sp.]